MTIEHDYGDDSHCRVCNAYGPNEDHIPCTTTQATPDRAAIEALARGCTDAQWDGLLDLAARGVTYRLGEREHALLAYLDEQVEAMRNDYIVLGRGWIVGEGAHPPPGELTPLGRAVLKRQEMSP